MVYYIKSPAAKQAASIQVCPFRYVHLGMSIQDGLGISKKEMDREDERKNQGAAVNGNGLCCCLERRKGRR